MVSTRLGSRIATRSAGRTPPAMSAPATAFAAASSSPYVSERPRHLTASWSGEDTAASAMSWCRRKPTGPPAPLQPEPAGDDAALDLRGSRVDRASDGVSEAALDPVLGHVSIAAEHLHRVEVGSHGRLAHKGLGHGRLDHRVAPVVHEPADAEHEGARRVHRD